MTHVFYVAILTWMILFVTFAYYVYERHHLFLFQLEYPQSKIYNKKAYLKSTYSVTSLTFPVQANPNLRT